MNAQAPLDAQALADKVAELEESRRLLESRRHVDSRIAWLSGIIRLHPQDTLASWSARVLDAIINTVHGLHATLYMVNETRTALTLTGTYAASLLNTPETIPMGEGLLGHAAVSGKLHYFHQPEQFVYTSMAGIRPSAIMLAPLMHEEQSEGVLEISALRAFSPEEMEILSGFCESLAAGVKNLRFQQQIQQLLSDAHEKSNRLQVQEEELRQNLEEMQAAQEHMRRQQAELEANQALITALINSAGDSIVAFDSAYTIILANSVFLKPFANSNFVVVPGQTALYDSHIHTAESWAFWKPFNDRALAGEIVHTEHSYQSPEGGTGYVELVFFPIRTHQGVIIGASVTSRDITERKMQERRLQEREAEREILLRQLKQQNSEKDATLIALINSTNDLVCAVNKQYQYITFNDAYREQQEKQQHQIQAGLSILEFCPQREKNKLKFRIDRALKGERFTIEDYTNAEDGSEVFTEVTMNPIKSQTGEVIAVSIFTRDITSRRQTIKFLEHAYAQIHNQQQETEAERNKLERMAAFIPGMIFQWQIRKDGTNFFTYVSQGIREVFGLPVGEKLEGNTLVKCIHSEDLASWKESVIRCLSKGLDWNWEGRVVLSDCIQKIRGTSRAEAQPDGGWVYSGIFQVVEKLVQAPTPTKPKKPARKSTKSKGTE